jgi:signal transduction histidine kinase
MDAFDGTARSEFQKRLEEEKLASLQAFAYGASHEINNPLANISMRAQTLLADETDVRKRELLFAIYRQALRAHAMIADMMTYARPPLPKLLDVDLVALAKTAVEEAREAAMAQSTSLKLVTRTGATMVSADANHILLALRALIDNALESLVQGGEIEVSVEDAVIIVRDTGLGMTEEIRRHCLDPFFSGREAGRGLGFGLPKCWAIMRQHDGEIEIESEPGEGTSVTLKFPVHSSGRS